MTTKAPTKGPLRVPLSAIVPGTRPLPPDAATYVARVHRLGEGDAFVVFDPENAIEADAEIVSVGRHEVTATFGPLRPAARGPRRQVTLIQGIGKGDKMDAIVRDATELGATRIVPALCERSISRPDPARSARWRRIAIEAARQCGRGDAPSIAAPTPFENAVRDAVAGEACLGLCMDPTAEGALGAALLHASDASRIIAVGPEGGFSPAELATAEAGGLLRVSLGPLILRTETVCAAVLGALIVWDHPIGLRT